MSSKLCFCIDLKNALKIENIIFLHPVICKSKITVCACTPCIFLVKSRLQSDKKLCKIQVLKVILSNGIYIFWFTQPFCVSFYNRSKEIHRHGKTWMYLRWIKNDVLKLFVPGPNYRASIRNIPFWFVIKFLFRFDEFGLEFQFCISKWFEFGFCNFSIMILFDIRLSRFGALYKLSQRFILRIAELGVWDLSRLYPFSRKNHFAVFAKNWWWARVLISCHKKEWLLLLQFL